MTKCSSVKRLFLDITLLLAVPSAGHSLGVVYLGGEAVHESTSSTAARPLSAPDPVLAGGLLTAPPGALLPAGDGPSLVLPGAGQQVGAAARTV